MLGNVRSLKWSGGWRRCDNEDPASLFIKVLWTWSATIPVGFSASVPSEYKHPATTDLYTFAITCESSASANGVFRTVSRTMQIYMTAKSPARVNNHTAAAKTAAGIVSATGPPVIVSYITDFGSSAGGR